MSWKNWPSWLKGGLVGVLIWIILIAILFLMMTTTQFDPDKDIFGILLFMPVFILRSWLNLSLAEDVMSYTRDLFFFYFFIGALIGFIIGKIKSKKQK